MDAGRIRNVALVGHGGSGKTLLAEALLHVGGAINRMGRIEDGSTVMDFEPEETARQISINLSVASMKWKNHKINLIDTPGYADFIGDARNGLRAADLALFVVSGVDGVEVQTEILWRIAEQEGIPRAIFVSKLDRERSSFSRTLNQLRDTFGKTVAPIQVPIGSEASLRGIVRAVSKRAYTYPSGLTASESDLPEEMAEEIEEVHNALVESVVETDDELLEKYFEGEEPASDQMVKIIHEGMISGEIAPVLCGSAEKLIGIDTLAEFIVDFGPSPAERPLPPADGEELVFAAEGATVAYVFKSLADPYVGRISLFRAFTGSVKADAELENVPAGGKARMHNLYFVQGKEHSDAPAVTAGDIGAVAKIDNALAGNTLRSGTPAVVTPVAMPSPVMELAVFPASAADEDKLSTALHKVEEEDPTLRVERRAETHETVVAGLGDTHLDVTVARMARKYGAEVRTETPTVPYRESITAPAEAEGKHKKQSGGRGQFGVAFVRFEPQTRGDGYEFVNAIKGGSIPRGFIPAVDKGIREALDRGILAGYPVVDVRATVYDGKYHAVDSDELSFRMAGIMAVRNAREQLRPILLEPVYKVTIRVPEDYMGDIIGDINAKRGRVLGMDSDGASRIVTADVPLAEMQRYAIDLRSMTGGRGSFEMEFTGYEEVPHQEAEKVIAASKKEEE